MLAWAAQELRIVLTHDQSTIPDFVAARINNNLSTPGVFIIPGGSSVKQVIADIEDSGFQFGRRIQKSSSLFALVDAQQNGISN